MTIFEIKNDYDTTCNALTFEYNDFWLWWDVVRRVCSVVVNYGSTIFFRI